MNNGFENPEDNVTSPFDVEPESNEPVVAPKTYTTEQLAPIFNQMDKAAKKIIAPLYVLREPLVELAELLRKFPNIKVDQTKEGQEWAEALSLAAGNSYDGDAFKDTVGRKEADFKQFVENDGVKLWAGKPVFGSSDNSQRLTGERALYKVVGALGLGTMVQIPLWHSGIWVSLKAPSASALMVLDRQIANEKIILGRETNGLVFSNRSVYTSKLVLDFVVDHIYETSIRDFNVTDKDRLYSLVRMTDIPTLIWGLACTIYPSGYPFRQPCMAGPDKCQHVSSLLINLPKIHWVDNKQITPAMRKHMADRTAKYSDEQIQQYQTERENSAVSELTPNLKVNFKTPSVKTYISAGYRWIDEIRQIIDRSFNTELSEEDREKFLMDQAVLTTLRQYSHWVNRLIVSTGSEEEFIDDQESLEPVISEISADPRLVESFFKAIARFIDEVTLAVVAVPRTRCPSCGEEMSEEEKRHPNLMAIDALNVFFTLLTQRLLQTRDLGSN